MILLPTITILSLSLFSSPCLAQFGLDRTTTTGPRGPRGAGGGDDGQQHDVNNNNVNNDVVSLNDLLLQEENDPELLQAFQVFADMSPQELMETTLELREVFSNDPQALEEMERVMKEIYKINRNLGGGSEKKTNRNDKSSKNHPQIIPNKFGTTQEEESDELVEQEEHPDLFSMVLSDTLDMLRNAKDEDWDLILQNKDTILNAVIHSGFMADEEAKIYQKDAAAWEEQLRIIWEELKKQAVLEDEF